MPSRNLRTETVKRAQLLEVLCDATQNVVPGHGGSSRLNAVRAHCLQHALDVGRIEPFGHQRCGIRFPPRST